MPLTPGARLGAYEILAALGAGGMGEVYRARDTRLGRDVAIKVLPDDVASSPDRLARFEREATTVAGLNHPGIVTLHSIEEIDGRRFLTMELVEGQGLDQHLTAGGMPIERVLDIGIAIADALAAAQEKGVVHRDLKPANVMVTRDGRIKVLDFGLAKLEPAAVTWDATQAATAMSPASSPGMILGTLPYMAPEQVRGEPVDARTDLFALGVMLYELASGVRPFTGPTAADIGSAILRDAPAALADRRRDTPADLERIVARCLAKPPRERFQTALDVADELRRVKRAFESRTASAAPRATVAVAVVPFVNMSHDPENEYFSDGLAEELLHVLGKIRGLSVPARSSAFAFKGRGATVAEMGRTLKVSAVLEGSVRKAGNRARIAVQLVEVASGYSIWSETYDRTLDDIFAVQDDIAQSVVKELRRALLGEHPDSGASGSVEAEVASAAKGRGHDPEAHRLYIEGRFLVGRGNDGDMARGVDRLRQAVERDPGHALAWAELSAAYSMQAAYGFVPQAEGQPRAREAAQRALQMVPDLVEGLVGLGWVQLMHDFDWAGARASYGRALALAPRHPQALVGAGWLALACGELEEAVRLNRAAIDADPLSSLAYSQIGTPLYFAGRHAEAEEAMTKALELAPDRVDTMWVLGSMWMDQGRFEETDALIARQTYAPLRLNTMAVLAHRRGDRAASDRALRELIERFADIAAYQVAEAYAVRGEAGATFEWLRRAHRDRDAGLTYVLADPNFASVHDDPRWGPFLEEMGLRGGGYR